MTLQAIIDAQFFLEKEKSKTHCFIVQLLHINEYGFFVLYYLALITNTVPQKNRSLTDYKCIHWLT